MMIRPGRRRNLTIINLWILNNHWRVDQTTGLWLIRSLHQRVRRLGLSLHEVGQVLLLALNHLLEHVHILPLFFDDLLEAEDLNGQVLVELLVLCRRLEPMLIFFDLFLLEVYGLLKFLDLKIFLFNNGFVVL